VNGFPVRNPRALVSAADAIEIVEPRILHGTLKLGAALERFAARIAGRVALDVGAAAGGFTIALLEANASRVYAVAGHGQLLGSLRQDERVVDLERTNLASLHPEALPEPIGVVAIDVSYVSLAAAVPQLRVQFAPDAELIALVKPQFELGLARPPDAPEPALCAARDGIEAAGWRIVGSMEPPISGRRGAREFFVHARR
jgi:23S rRNA (cytidine1920-2'-O)/16S rRNA (cytidine1409-2'-O)-methyltransferase